MVTDCQKSKQKVTFDLNDRTFMVPIVNDSDLHMIWYDVTELRTIATKNQRIIHAIGCYVSRPEIIEERMMESIRGFESHAIKYQRTMRRAKRDAKRIVLEEQHRQMTAGVYQPERIATAYAEKSRPSAEYSARMGLQDARQVLEQQKTIPGPGPGQSRTNETRAVAGFSSKSRYQNQQPPGWNGSRRRHQLVHVLV